MKDRVAKGLAFLLDKCPEKVALIDLDKLDMWSSKDCVLGQILGDFWACYTLGIKPFDVWEYGFTDTDCEKLTLAWKDALNERSRSSGSPSDSLTI